MKKISEYIKKHKKISAFVAVIAVVVIYFIVSALKSSTTDTQHTLSPVERGNVIVTVTGSGQVSALDQIDIKSKASGDVLTVNAGSGSVVKEGDVIAEIDSRDAYMALQSARIAYTKLTQPADTVSRLQSENSLASAVESSRQASDNIIKAYDDGFNVVTASFIDFPDIINGLNDLLNNYSSPKGYLNDIKISSYGELARTYRDKAAVSHSVASIKFQKALELYKNVNRASATSTIEAVIASSYDTMKSLTEAVKDAKNAIEYVKATQISNGVSDPNAVTALASAVTWTTKANTDLADLASARNTINNAKIAVINSSQSVKEKQESLTKLINGVDPLDVQSELLSLRQKEYAYADTFIKAPFDGVIAKLDIKKGNTISSGSVVATIVNKNMAANISLNEVDAVKIKLGQKVNLTFDAIDNLNITGKVTGVDLVGTVTQGVVTYNVEITFDTQDDSVRSGMSVNASIITAVKTDVLVVPNSALKSGQYVETFSGETGASVVTQNTPDKIMVGTGLTNDEFTEITSGLKEGDPIITKSVAVTSTATKTTAPNIFSAAGAGGNRGGTGSVRSFTR